MPKSYVRGKRKSFLDPIRMYLFTSALFFLVFFSVKDYDKAISRDLERYLNKSRRMELVMELGALVRQHPEDSLLRKQLLLLQDSVYKISLDSSYARAVPDSMVQYRGKTYRMHATADSTPYRAIDVNGKGWLGRRIAHKAEEFNTRYGDDPGQGFGNLVSFLAHRVPYLLFISLPFFALLLKLLYVRRRSFMYSDHAVFTLYHYIFSFILLLFIYLFSWLNDRTGWQLFDWLAVITSLFWPVYLYISMRRFYEQGWMKTFWKFLLLNFLGVFLMLVLALFFIIFSIFQF